MVIFPTLDMVSGKVADILCFMPSLMRLYLEDLRKCDHETFL
ncbi:hypothetical protein [Anabaena sp. 4-3]|nr:hypothetical protein [Anabaena sp. 4-3]